MLTDKIADIEKREPALLVQRTGTCRFCGQMATLEAPETWSDEDIDELATECCKCQEAKDYAYKKKKEGTGHRSNHPSIWAIPGNGDHQGGDHGTAGGNR